MNSLFCPLRSPDPVFSYCFHHSSLGQFLSNIIQHLSIALIWLGYSMGQIIYVECLVDYECTSSSICLWMCICGTLLGYWYIFIASYFGWYWGLLQILFAHELMQQVAPIVHMSAWESKSTKVRGGSVLIQLILWVILLPSVSYLAE